MPRIIFVSGMDETGSSSILEMVLEGSRKRLSKHIRLGFERRELDKLKGMIVDDSKKVLSSLFKKIESQASAALKSGISVVVEGPLTLKTEDGYLPLVPKGFFRSFSPDAFILFESPNTGKNSKIDFIQQEVNRSYAAMYASLGGSALKIIPVGRGGVKNALKECTQVIDTFLGM
jgi:adenylate kinase